jgi:3D-(3,5/4)-trihydroxycyclohexane-1,2-dione acylhydrolase (decyclizing)
MSDTFLTSVTNFIATGCKTGIFVSGHRSILIVCTSVIISEFGCGERVLTQVGGTITLTVAQAVVRYLAAQYIEIDGEKTRICGGGFGIFGHGNVACLGEALYERQDELPLYRGQNEQGMGFAAAAYAKAHLRRRFMFCTASAGPGTANLLTSAGLAHANRLPMLMLCGDAFITRLPDPVLQQLEHYGNPTLGLNDAFSCTNTCP